MHLLTEPWLPVRTRMGARVWIGPQQLGDPDIVAFDANRADLNGALAQFAIGLLQTASPVANDGDWRNWFAAPPDADTLAHWFAPYASAFELDGDKARFMQDLTLGPLDGTTVDIGALFIDEPGENTLRNNADHFIKRDRINALCPHCAAAALFTLHTNAPAGGVGHRTGLRGGGPLTTLVIPDEAPSLWHKLWMNVMPTVNFHTQSCDAGKTALHFRFPWLVPIETLQTQSGETAPAQVHPAQLYWAMPRRIRLDFGNPQNGHCSVCARESTQLVTRYQTKNYGMNYKGAWDHPLSPYYYSKEERLPLHPQPGGFGYRHWLSWVLGVNDEKRKLEPAKIIAHALSHKKRQIKGGLRLWAFGYDMDNMKPRCWYETTMPLYHLDEADAIQQKMIAEVVGIWLATADQGLSILRGSVKDAWFSRDARGDFSHIDASFWSATEPRFYAQLQELLTGMNQPEPIPMPEVQKLHEAWYEYIKKQAVNLFESVFVGTGPVSQQNPKRIAKAHWQLVNYLGGPKMRKTAGLPDLEDKKPAKADGKKAGKGKSVGKTDQAKE